MISNDWVKRWVQKKIKYYEGYLKHNQDTPVKNDIEKCIRTLKDLKF